MHLAAHRALEARRRPVGLARKFNAYRAALDAAGDETLLAMRETLRDVLKKVGDRIARTPADRFDAAFLPRLREELQAELADVEVALRASLRNGQYAAAAAAVNVLPVAGVGRVATTYGAVATAVVRVAVEANGELIAGLTDWTTSRIMGEVRRGVLGVQSQMDTIKAIAHRLDEDGAPLPRAFHSVMHRAEVITRTETNRIGAAVQIQAAKDVEAATPGLLEKVWLTARDNRVRTTHEVLDEKHLPVDDLFNVGGTLAYGPMDDGLPPEEVINCRCQLILEVAKE